jgi:8-hydroxy-5-deazaflavin:NADPH oxidoreductase
MKLGILGTGKVAVMLAAAWRKAGHEITFGSRDPSSKNLGFEVTRLPDCVSGADVVVNAILGSAALETISAMDADLFAGKTVIDVSNATTPQFELTYSDSSLAGRLQEALPSANVVKSMNTAAMSVVTRATIVPTSSLFLSGDSGEAKRKAAGLIRDLGWSDEEIVDLGGIETARGPEHYAVMFATLAGALKSEAFNIRLVR